MRIKSLLLKEGIFANTDTFSDFTLIHSKQNSKGKSTYLRLLFYALGYAIPSMKGLEYSRIYSEIVLSERGREFKIVRSLNSMTVENNEDNTKLIYALLSEHTAFLSYIFDSDKIKILNNILGIMYVDQDKGWSLLNRGTVIGKIHFSIEELVAGLSGIDCDELLVKKQTLKNDEKKYLAMININDLSEEVYANNGEIFISDVEKELASAISLIDLQIRDLKDKIGVIEASIKKEEDFWKFIDSMCLRVKHEDLIIDVNRNTVIHSSEPIEYLKARKNLLGADMKSLLKQKAELQLKLDKYYATNSEWTQWAGDTQETIINRQLSTFSFDQDTVNKLLTKTQSDLRKVTKQITGILRSNNEVIQKIFNHVKKYAKMLKIQDKIDANKDYIFTSDLKSFSGANLQKLVFAFKVAFLKAIEEVLGTKLIFVLDSPRGKELDSENLKLIMKIVEEDLAENQVIVASIYDDFNYSSKIELVERAIEQRC